MNWEGKSCAGPKKMLPDAAFINAPPLSNETSSPLRIMLLISCPFGIENIFEHGGIEVNEVSKTHDAPPKVMDSFARISPIF
jgi:hypothetical protein